MLLQSTRTIARKCGLNIALKRLALSYIIRLDNLLYRKLYRKMKERVNRTSIEDGLEVIKSYIDLRKVGIEKTIPINLPPFDQGLSKDIMLYHIREPMHTKILYDLINRHNIKRVIDVGSNIGYFPLIELSAGAESIVAIEPVVDAFQYLHLNLKPCTRCYLLNVAANTDNSPLEIYVPLDKTGRPVLNWASVGRGSSPLNSLANPIKKNKVRSLPFDNLLETYGGELVRMDIEGFEWILFSSLREIPENVRMVDFEAHKTSNKQYVRSTLDMFLREGFEKVLIIPDIKVPDSLVCLFKGLHRPCPIHPSIASVLASPQVCNEEELKQYLKQPTYVETQKLLVHIDKFVHLLEVFTPILILMR